MVEYLLRSPDSAVIRDEVENPDVVLHTTALCGVELASALRRAMASGRLPESRARNAIEDFLDLPLTRYHHEPLLERIADLRHNFSAYDAAYVALAEALGADLLTADRRLASVAGARFGIRTLPA